MASPAMPAHVEQYAQLEEYPVGDCAKRRVPNGYGKPRIHLFDCHSMIAIWLTKTRL